MTFVLETAKKLIEYYKFLLEEKFDGLQFTHLVVAPNYGDKFSSFLANFYHSGNADHSLWLSGFDRENVLVLLINHNTYETAQLYYELDNFLSQYRRPKVYDGKGDLIVPL